MTTLLQKLGVTLDIEATRKPETQFSLNDNDSQRAIEHIADYLVQDSEDCYQERYTRKGGNELVPMVGTRTSEYQICELTREWANQSHSGVTVQIHKLGWYTSADRKKIRHNFAEVARLLNMPIAWDEKRGARVRCIIGTGGDRTIDVRASLLGDQQLPSARAPRSAIRPHPLMSREIAHKTHPTHNGWRTSDDTLQPVKKYFRPIGQ